MRTCAVVGLLGFILILQFLISQEVVSPQEEPMLLAASVAVETTESTQAKKISSGASQAENVPQLLWHKKPEYPQSALKERAEGVVETILYVNKQGSVSRVEITQSSGHEDLDSAAVQAARQYRFTPAKLNGALVNSWVSTPFHFRIPSGLSSSGTRTPATVLPPIVVGRDEKGGGEVVAKSEGTKSDDGPRFARIVRPKYSEITKNQKVVKDVAVTIDDKGDVIAVSSRSDERDELTNVALASAAKCKFVPARKNGRAVESSAVIRYVFDGTEQETSNEPRAGDERPAPKKNDSAQTARDTVFESAENNLSRGNTSAAEQLYLSLVKLGDEYRGSMGLGRISLIREDWASARHQFDKVLELNQSSIEAHYYGAISYRESGRFRFGKEGQTHAISIEHAFSTSMEYFQWVIQHDSTFRDVLYQYSLLMKDQERYGDAMRALCDQIRLKPDLPVALTGVVRLIKSAIRAEHSADLRAQWRTPLEGLESYVRAEELRVRGSLKESERMLVELLAKPTNFPSQIPYLSLLRLYAKTGQFQKLEENYWKSVNDIKGEAGAALMFDDLKYILSPQELLAFPSLSFAQKHDQFFSSVWNRRNPTLASPSNPRLHEHYQRLVYANENYSSDRERYSFYYEKGHPGLDFDFSDMGRVYIRQGPPDEVFKEGGAAGTSEAWHYNSIGESPEMTFQFYGAEKNFSAGSLGSAATALNPGQPYSPWPQRSFGYSNTPPRETNRELLRNPMETDIRVKRPEMSDLAFWDPDYYDLWRVTSAEDAHIAIRAARRIADRRKESYAAALTTERFDSDKSKKIFHLPAAISTFRAGTGKSVLEVAYAVPAASLVRESGDTLKPMNVESGFAIYDSHWRKIVSVAETLKVSLSDPATNSYFRFHQTQVKPDSYYVAVYAHPLDGSVLAKSETKVFARDYWNSGFTMSDPQLAFEIRKEDEFSMFDKEGLRVVVNPLGRQAVNRPMYVYFELYNTTEISKEQADLGLELVIRPVQGGDGVVSKVLGLFSSDKKGYFVTSEVDHWKTKKALAKYLVVDVTRLQAGRYVLDLKVEDKPTKKSVSRTVEFELVGK